MTITKADLTDSICKGLGLPKSRASELLTSLLAIMKTTLVNGDDILISGFGKFCVNDKNDRIGRNPSTGEDMMLEARRVVTFKCYLPLRLKLKKKSEKGTSCRERLAIPAKSGRSK